MKANNRTSLRAVVVLFFIVLTVVCMYAGAPALAASFDIEVLTAQNSCPIAKNLDYNTFKGIAIRGQLAATDPDGDKMMFEVTDVPKKGTIESQSDGCFVYTPNDGKKGQDSFSYVAIDSNGNTSEKAEVTITISKQATKITYADMNKNCSYYAALTLAEKGILIGEKLGNEFFFRPESSVTRGEFLAMCLGMTDTETLDGITRTGFSDDESIPLWAKPYVSTALLSGIITGYKNDAGQLVFSAQEPITFSEAAVILNNVLKLSDVVSVIAVDSDSSPVWAYQAQANLLACNIMPALGTESYNRCVSRAEAADMIVTSIELLDKRDGKTSLLSWAK